MKEDEAVSRWSEALKFEKQKVEQVKIQLQEYPILRMHVSVPADLRPEVINKELQRSLRDLELDEDVLYRTPNRCEKTPNEQTDLAWKHLTLTKRGEVKELPVSCLYQPRLKDN